MSFREPEGNTRREPVTTAIRIQGAYLMQDASGVWGFTSDRTEAEGAFAAGASGVLGIDDAVTVHESGLTVRLVGASRALVYTVSRHGTRSEPGNRRQIPRQRRRRRKRRPPRLRCGGRWGHGQRERDPGSY